MPRTTVVPRMTAVKGTEFKIGEYTLVEKDLYSDGVFMDTICEVFYRGKSETVYCSISDAVRHKGEWYTE